MERLEQIWQIRCGNFLPVYSVVSTSISILGPMGVVFLSTFVPFAEDVVFQVGLVDRFPVPLDNGTTAPIRSCLSHGWRNCKRILRYT